MSININRIIAHEIDLTKETPMLAEKVIELSNIPTIVFDFFKDHITKSLKARQIKACKFNDPDTYVQKKVSIIAENPIDETVFINVSKELASDFFNKIKGTSSKSSGTFFILTYNYSDSDYIGILKMDPNDGIQIDNKSNRLIVHENMLPDPDDNLHKCAFIKLVNDFSSVEVHLDVLDRQQTAGEVSKFFMTNFLQATEILNDKIMTKRVFNTLYYKAELISPNNKLKYESDVERSMKDGNDFDFDRNIDTLLKPYLEGEADREQMINTLKDEIRTEYQDVKFQFKIEKEPTYVQYTSQGKEIKLEFKLDLLDDKIIFDDSGEETVIRIRDIELIKKFK